jgi:hypothetical protein
MIGDASFHRRRDLQSLETPDPMAYSRIRRALAVSKTCDFLFNAIFRHYRKREQDPYSSFSRPMQPRPFDALTRW